MKRFALLAVLGLCAFGCNQEPKEETPAETPATTSNAPAPGDGGVNIVGSGAGGLAPVTGTENLQGSGGGGSGAGQVAKDRARGIAGSAPSSLNQMGQDGGE